MKLKTLARALAELGYRVVIVKNDDPLMHEFPETLDDPLPDLAFACKDVENPPDFTETDAASAQEEVRRCPAD